MNYRKCKSLRYLIFSRGSKLRPPSPPPKYTETTYEFPSQLELVELRPIKGDFSFLGRITRHFCEVKYLGIGNNSSKGAVPSMFTKMQRLVILDCTNCDTMTDDVIGKVAECCPLLESFCLNGCTYVYGWTFCTLFRSYSPLRTLLLRYTPVRGLPYGYPMAHPMAYRWFLKLGSALADGQNTDPQSMDYHNGLPNWTTLKWTAPKNNNPNEYYI